MIRSCVYVLPLKTIIYLFIHENDLIIHFNLISLPSLEIEQIAQMCLWALIRSLCRV